MRAVFAFSAHVSRKEHFVQQDPLLLTIQDTQIAITYDHNQTLSQFASRSYEYSCNIPLAFRFGSTSRQYCAKRSRIQIHRPHTARQRGYLQRPPAPCQGGGISYRNSNRDNSAHERQRSDSSPHHLFKRAFLRSHFRAISAPPYLLASSLG